MEHSHRVHARRSEVAAHLPRRFNRPIGHLWQRSTLATAADAAAAAMHARRAFSRHLAMLRPAAALTEQNGRYQRECGLRGNRLSSSWA